jgi:hypothetical protein
MDFEERLQKAIERGHQRGEANLRAEKAKTVTEEDLKRLHAQYRLQLSDHIERCIRRLTNHFPGFQFETIYGERGWGAACKRDDLRMARVGKRDSLYSRLEMTVRPVSSLYVLELSAKGTIQNKELYNRTHYEQLGDADPDQFIELIDLWVLEYAELYAAKV